MAPLCLQPDLRPPLIFGHPFVFFRMQLPHPEQVILLDIETVSQQPDYQQLPADWQLMWEEKTRWQWPEGVTAADFYAERAAILAEFGKIICISVGYFRTEGTALQLRLKSFAAASEPELLKAFVQVMGQLIQFKKTRMWLAGHNIREFDVPYLCRRLLVNGMALPAWLDFQSVKPWEVPLLDTMQLWKFGDYKHYTSLNLLAACLGIPSPKDDMHGGMVGEVYWKDQNLARIVEYCQKDVVTVGQLLLRFSNLPLLQPDQVVVLPA